MQSPNTYLRITSDRSANVTDNRSGEPRASTLSMLEEPLCKCLVVGALGRNRARWPGGDPVRQPSRTLGELDVL